MSGTFGIFALRFVFVAESGTTTPLRFVTIFEQKQSEICSAHELQPVSHHVEEADVQAQPSRDDAPTSPGEPDHGHMNVCGGWLRAAVFGATAGLVTNSSLIAGVRGGGAATHIIVLTGAAGLVAGVFSMATGEYISITSQNEAVRAEVATEKTAQQQDPQGEIAELAESYIARGISRATATAFARELAASPGEAVRVHVQEELGVDVGKLPGPWIASGSSFASFALGALLPLLPYLIGVSSLFLALAVSAVASLAAGAPVARITGHSPVRNGPRQLALGALSVGATFLIGPLLGANA
jgi:vacuolar iron transporter family protein